MGRTGHEEDVVRKLALLAAVAVGYVLGARAGRGRYEQIRQLARRVQANPTVQQKSHRAADLAKDATQTAASAAADKAQAAAAAAVGKVRGHHETTDESGIGWPQASESRA